MPGELDGVVPLLGRVGPPVQGAAAHGDGVAEEPLGEGREDVEVDAAAARRRPEDGHGRGVAAVRGDVLLNPPEV